MLTLMSIGLTVTLLYGEQLWRVVLLFLFYYWSQSCRTSRGSKCSAILPRFFVCRPRYPFCFSNVFLLYFALSMYVCLSRSSVCVVIPSSLQIWNNFWLILKLSGNLSRSCLRVNLGLCKRLCAKYHEFWVVTPISGVTLRLKSVSLPVSVCWNVTTWLTNRGGACGMQNMISKYNQ